MHTDNAEQDYQAHLDSQESQESETANEEIATPEDMERLLNKPRTMTGSAISKAHYRAEIAADEIEANENQIRGIRERKRSWKSIDMETAQLDAEIKTFREENSALRQAYKEKLETIIKGI